VLLGLADPELRALFSAGVERARKEASKERMTHE
jgi:hypothetical protein